MSEMKKSAYRITTKMLEEMITDYIKKHEGKNVEHVHVTLDVPTARIDSCRQDLLSGGSLHVLTVTWDD